MWTSDAASIACLFQNKVTFLLKIMVLHDEPLLNSKPTLSDDLLVPQGWPLTVYRGSTVNGEF